MERIQPETFQETKQHGTVLFPFTIYPCTIPLDPPSVPLHWHKSMELVYVKKGCGQVQVGMTAQEAVGGDVFILPPGTLHALHGVPGSTMEYENIIFDLEFLGYGAADVCASRYLVPLAAGRLALPSVLRAGQPEYADVIGCISEMEDLCGERGTGYELGIRAAVLKLLFLLLRMESEQNAVDTPGMMRLKVVLQQVEKDYAKPLTVSQAAENCGYSTSHFMRWFKQMTGCSFTTYLNEHRLAEAAYRLRESSDTILRIAGEVGFENLSNFNRQFKARYGVTPKEYRRYGVKPQ